MAASSPRNGTTTPIRFTVRSALDMTSGWRTTGAGFLRFCPASRPEFVGKLRLIRRGRRPVSTRAAAISSSPARGRRARSRSGTARCAEQDRQAGADAHRPAVPAQVAVDREEDHEAGHDEPGARVVAGTARPRASDLADRAGRAGGGAAAAGAGGAGRHPAPHERRPQHRGQRGVDPDDLGRAARCGTGSARRSPGRRAAGRRRSARAPAAAPRAPVTANAPQQHGDDPHRGGHVPVQEDQRRAAWWRRTRRAARRRRPSPPRPRAGRRPSRTCRRR